jgi:hypothetical protein
MPQQNQAPQGASNHVHPVHVTALALRSAGQLYDINLSMARTLLRTQVRAAAAFGLPDWSPLLDNADDRARQLFSTGAEQILHTTQRANDAAQELQRQVGRVIETQTQRAAETWQRGLQELGSQTSQGLQQLCQAARETAEEAERAVDTMAQQSQQAMQQGNGNANGQHGQPSQGSASQGQSSQGQQAQGQQQAGSDHAGQQQHGGPLTVQPGSHAHEAQGSSTPGAKESAEPRRGRGG